MRFRSLPVPSHSNKLVGFAQRSRMNDGCMTDLSDYPGLHDYPKFVIELISEGIPPLAYPTPRKGGLTMDDDTSFELSRRKLLGATGTIGAAGALGGVGTTAFFSDEEEFTNNRLVAGEFDLKVDWEGTYWNWIDNPTIVSDDPSDGLGDND